jgi:acyl-homoserine lactone acylase PvdQ
VGVLAVAPAAGAVDYAERALNVLPSGQYQSAGPGADAQAQLYNNLTPRYDNVTDADLPNFFKSEALGPTTVVSEETPRPGVTIRRDDYNVPHVFGTTNDDVIFGAGWVAAADRLLLLNQGRYNGITAAIDAPNLSSIDLISNLYSFEPSAQANRIVDRQTRVIQAAGPRGVQLLHDIDVYLSGINAWIAANTPNVARFTRRDIYAFNAVKGQFLGEGGGGEAAASQLLDGLQRKFGADRGYRVWQDLRNRKDPEHKPTLRNRFDYDTATGSRRGTVTLRNGSFVREGGVRASSKPIPRGEASNILIVSGQRSATGRPLFVGGPQIGYFFPGLTHEIGMYGPDIQVRGATAVPFPGYMLIGRGEDFAWTLTSSSGDIVDTYAETLCGGSRAKYLYRGRCRNMETIDAGTLKLGEQETRVRFRQTVHGPVIGYARTTGGRTVAISRKRSSYGRDTVDQLFFQDLTFGRVKSFSDFAQAAARTPQTFNAFYADHQTSGLFSTGRLPLRPRGADGSLVTDGRGGFEWNGVLSNARHPQGSNPANGLIINWNNSPATGYVSGRFGSEGPLQRNNLLLNEIARTDKHTLGSVTAAMNAGAVQDPRGALLWPTIRKVLEKADSPSPLAAEIVAQLDLWAARRAPRIDQDRDGNIDDAGVPIMDGIWTTLADAALCGPIGKSLCTQLDRTLHGRFSQPPGGGQYSGWHHYISKDLRALLGERVRGGLSRRYCANTVEACAQKLWAAIQTAGTGLAEKFGQGPDPAAWREPRSENLIKFGPLPLIDMDYTNRPSGIQQVITFNGHR